MIGTEALPQVSVVIPVYNAAAHIDTSVPSVLAQTLRRLEVIAVDDGSTDTTPDLLRGFTDSRLRVLRQENSGYPHAMNTGLAVARGEYVARMDADDIMAAERLERQVEFLERHPEYAFVGTLYETITPNGKTCGSPSVIGLPPWSPVSWDDVMNGHRRFADPSVTFRREAAMSVGGYRTYQRSGQDVDLWLRMLESGVKGACLNVVLHRSRITIGAISDTRGNIARNKIPRLLAMERRTGGKDRVMMGRGVEGMVTADVEARSRTWFIRNLWRRAEACLAVGDYRAGIRYLGRALEMGGAGKESIRSAAQLVYSILRRALPPGRKQG